MSGGPNFRFQQGNRPQKRGKFNADEKPPPAGYTCKICGSHEHYIQSCPDKSSKSDVPPPGYVCKACGASDHYIRLCPQRSHARSREAITAVAPQDCWFCLSNPQCAKHLIVSIGEESYLALPKGHLPSSAAPSSSVPGGGHVLIVPIAHVPSPLVNPPAVAQPLVDEIEKYKQAISQTYKAYDAIPFSWEYCKLSHTRVGHMQVQVIPVPLSKSETLLSSFLAAAEAEGYSFKQGDEAHAIFNLGEEGESQQERQARAEYVRVDIGSDTLALSLRSHKFSMQFPR